MYFWRTAINRGKLGVQIWSSGEKCCEEVRAEGPGRLYHFGCVYPYGECLMRIDLSKFEATTAPPPIAIHFSTLTAK